MARSRRKLQSPPRRGGSRRASQARRASAFRPYVVPRRRPRRERVRKKRGKLAVLAPSAPSPTLRRLVKAAPRAMILSRSLAARPGAPPSVRPIRQAAPPSSPRVMAQTEKKNARNIARASRVPLAPPGPSGDPELVVGAALAAYLCRRKKQTRRAAILASGKGGRNGGKRQASPSPCS